mmetsp:Transcript_127609/g.408450  ORF Transcript_127609/g.408450 Transcript_127609/m.408450 type:complete len:207 (-) Transcript_127609:187-807(-)
MPRTSLGISSFCSLSKMASTWGFRSADTRAKMSFRDVGSATALAASLEPWEALSQSRTGTLDFTYSMSAWSARMLCTFSLPPSRSSSGSAYCRRESGSLFTLEPRAKEPPLYAPARAGSGPAVRPGCSNEPDRRGGPSKAAQSTRPEAITRRVPQKLPSDASLSASPAAALAVAPLSAAPLPRPPASAQEEAGLTKVSVEGATFWT